MLRLILVSLCTLSLLGQVSASDEVVEVFSGSRRFSLEIPADWVTATNDRMGNIGDNLFIAEDIEALNARLAGRTEHGASIVVSAYPVATLIGMGISISNKSDEELLLLSMNDVLPETVTFSTISGYPSASVRHTARLSHTTVLAEGLFYQVAAESTAASDEISLQAIIQSLSIYPTGQAGQRDPFVVEGMELPVEPGWLIWQAYSIPFMPLNMVPPGSRPQSFLIIPENSAEIMEQAFLSIFREQQVEVLTSPVILVTAYPFDSLFGTADLILDDAQRQQAVEAILAELGAEYETQDVITIDGLPVTRTTLTTIFNSENTGETLIWEANRYFYALTVAGGSNATAYLQNFSESVTLAATSTEIGVQVGMQAPDFTMQLADGSEAKLSDYRGKPVLINFWASWCDPCVDEMPQLRRLYEKYPDIVILAVNFMEPSATVDAFITEHELGFPVALDEQGSINDLYRIRAYPTNIMLDADGIIVGFPDHMGHDLSLEDWIERIQTGEF